MSQRIVYAISGKNFFPLFPGFSSRASAEHARLAEIHEHARTAALYTEGVTTSTSPQSENEREFARKYVALKYKIDLHGCEDPQHCPECAPHLYQIGVLAIRLGIITPKLPAERFDNLPEEIDYEQIQAAYQHDPRDE